MDNINLNNINSYLKKISKNNNIIISHENRKDRLGSFLGIDLFTYAYCNYNNYEFKFYHIENNPYINLNDIHSFLGWDSIIKYTNQTDNFIRVSELDFSKEKEENIILFDTETNKIQNLMNNQSLFNNYFPFEFRNSLHQNFININSYFPIYFKKNMTNIAIHIRRGDITQEYYTHAYFSNKYFIELINELKQKYKNYNIHIFSCKTNNEGWNDFNNLDVKLHLREDWSNDNLKYEKIDMVHFIKADVLVIGGTFSYVPAFFNLNDVYYPNKYWHPKLNHWIDYQCKK